MAKKKRLEWTGKYRDQRAGKYRVLWSSVAWTLSYDGKQISRHGSKEQATRKAATGARPAVKVAKPKRRAPKPAKRDLIGQLCDAVGDAGGTMRLHGVPVTEGELRAHGEQLVDDKLAAIERRHIAGATAARHADLSGRVPYTKDQLDLPVPSVAVAAWDAWAKDNMKTAEELDRPPGRDLDAIEYKHTRAADPDCRDEDDVHVSSDGEVTLIGSMAIPPTEPRPSLSDQSARHGITPLSVEERRENLATNLDDLQQPRSLRSQVVTPDDRFDTGGDL